MNTLTNNLSNSNLTNVQLAVNIISLSVSEQVSRVTAEQISNQKTDINGLYTNTINNTHVVVYPRWPNCSKILANTAVSDAMIINISSNDELIKISDYINSKERVHLLLFWTDNEDIKQLASEYKNGKFLSKKDYNAEQIRNLIIEETRTFNKTIKNIFDTMDINKNGFLEKKEVLAFARERGDNVSSQEFNDTLNLIDRHGLGKICFEDFEKWWKMGGHTSSIFGRLVQLNEMSRDIMIADDKFQLLKSDLNGIKQSNKIDLSSHLIKINSTEKFENPGFQLFGNILIGGVEKDQALSLYLQRFSDDHLNANQNKNWFQMVLTVEPNEAKKVVNSIRLLRNSLLELLEKNNRSATSFIRSFFNIEDKIIGNQVLLTFTLKIDLQSFFENAVLPIMQFFDLFTCSQDSTSQFLFDFSTKFSLKEILEGNKSVKEALSGYSLELKANMLRGHLRKIVGTYKPSRIHNEIINLVWLATSPNTVDFNCTMDSENVLSEDYSSFKLGFLGEIIDYYINQYELIIPFLKKITNVEFALHFNKLFVDLRSKIRKEHV